MVTGRVCDYGDARLQLQRLVQGSHAMIDPFQHLVPRLPPQCDDLPFRPQLLEHPGVPLAYAAQPDDQHAIGHHDSAFWLAAV